MQPIESSGMDIIQRNFFRILCSGAFGTQSNLEPMSPFKWRRLMQMVDAQQVMPIFINGVAKHSMDEGLNLPDSIIADMTCDSDGKIDRFPENGEVSRALPLHHIKEDEEYYLGAFLVGAYQETLGDLHNLLGDTHVVSIYINEDGSYDFVGEVEGDSVADVLSYVEYQPNNLLLVSQQAAVLQKLAKLAIYLPNLPLEKQFKTNLTNQQKLRQLQTQLVNQA